jgi:septum formation protein
MGKNQSLNTPYPLILASTSKYRQVLLAQLGLSFTSLAPDFNEDSLKNKGLLPRNLSSDLARHKAMAVFNLNPQSCVIGSDQVCVQGDKILSKPKTKEKAIEQLQLLQGKSHQLITAVSIIYPDGELAFINETLLKMRPLNEEQIIRYINLENPLDCAGSYKLESQGIKLFESISMSDHTAIIGLPLIELCNLLIKIGYHI